MPNRTVMAMRRPVGVAASDRLVQHAAAELRVEGLSRSPLRQRCSAEAVGAHTRCRQRSSRELCQELLPAGVLNVVHGLGGEVGPPLVEHQDVDLVSFTGSASTGRWINERAGTPAGEGLPRARR